MDRRKFLTLLGAAPIAAGAAAAGIPSTSAKVLSGTMITDSGWSTRATTASWSNLSIKWDDGENSLVNGMDGIEGAMDSLTGMVDSVASNTVEKLNYGVKKMEYISELPIKPWVKMANSYASKVVKVVDDTQNLAEDTIEAIEEYHGEENETDDEEII